MRIIYLGTPDFAVASLQKLIEKGYDIVACVTNKDKPVGRKHILTPPPVKTVAIENNIPVLQYDKIRVEGVDDIKSLKPDLMITCAFGQILSQEILDIPTYGVFNIHASLLPLYRGASPIHFAILNGEKESGVTIMRTEAGIDTGDIILQKSVKIGDNETCGELFDKLSVLGADLIIDALNMLENKTINYIKQDENKASFTKIIKKEMAEINFNNDADSIINQIRAFNPSPVAFAFLNGQPFKIYEGEKVNIFGEVGKILKCDNQLVVGCKNGGISFKKVQKAGGKPMNISDFLRGNKFNIGDKFQ